ncbi:MAG: hypothetical protein P4L90_17020 [Rhodopila sp.]|nr:hypothetical protein [Rhodopila sp.]
MLGGPVESIRRRGLTLFPSDAILVDGIAPNAVRICFEVARTRNTMHAALRSVEDRSREDASMQDAEVV